MKNKLPQAELNTLSARLKYLIDEAGIKQTKLAAKLGISPQTINQLCHNDFQESKYAVDLAKALNANPAWLQTGIGDPHLSETRLGSHQQQNYSVPIFSMEQLFEATHGGSCDLSKLTPIDKKFLDSSYSSHAFGIYLRDNQFSPRFEKGDLIIIDRVLKFTNASLGLVYSQEFNDIFFCYLYSSKDGQTIFGLSPDKSIGIFIIGSNDLIYGIHRESIKRSIY